MIAIYMGGQQTACQVELAIGWILRLRGLLSWFNYSTVWAGFQGKKVTGVMKIKEKIEVHAVYCYEKAEETDDVQRGCRENSVRSGQVSFRRHRYCRSLARRNIGWYTIDKRTCRSRGMFYFKSNFWEKGDKFVNKVGK